MWSGCTKLVICIEVPRSQACICAHRLADYEVSSKFIADSSPKALVTELPDYACEGILEDLLDLQWRVPTRYVHLSFGAANWHGKSLNAT